MGIHLSNHFSLDADNVKVINNGNINQQNKGALVFTQNSYSYENKAKIKDSEISGNATNGSALVNRAAGFTIEGYSLDNTVIKNNIGKYVGGLSINGQTQSSKKIKFTMNSGAIFGNSAKEEYSDGIFPNDVYVENNATVKIPSINKMAENESSIANYYWNNYSSSNGYKFNSLGQDTGINLSSSTSSKNIYNVSEFGIRNIAKINEQKYTTLKDAFDKVQNGETIVFIAGEDDNSGTKIPESITYSGNKNITIDLNGKQWEGSSKAAKALTINGTGNGPNITIKGEG